MAFDPEVHAIDPKTGFIVDKEHGGVAGLVPAPVKSVSTEWPKWVPVHASHLDGGVAQAFLDTFTDRKGIVSVLVRDAEEEARRLLKRSAPSFDETKIEAT